MENLKNIAPLEEFNWEEYEKGNIQSEQSQENQEKSYDSTLSKLNDSEVVDGTVITMNKREVVVNIGYKSDGVIPLNEFRYNPELKVVDTVEVYIENLEDKKGQLALSHRKARASRSWERVNNALDNEYTAKYHHYSGLFDYYACLAEDETLKLDTNNRQQILDQQLRDFVDKILGEPNV